MEARNIGNIVLMRPINSMIKFKQIIGRGTRLYDGKDYFTIYGLVKSHHHFSDSEWDGEPIEPEQKVEGKVAPPSPPPVDGVREEPVEYVRKKRIKVKLADGKARTVQHMMITTFWHPDGTPMSAQQSPWPISASQKRSARSSRDFRSISINRKSKELCKRVTTMFHI